MESNYLVFLGGTVGGNNWRTEFIQALVERGVPKDALFNPVVVDWNDEARAREERVKAEARYLLFYIANPNQEGNSRSAYSMVEATMALYDKPDRAVVVFDSRDVSGHPLKDMNHTFAILRERFPKGNMFLNYQDAIDWFVSHLA